MERQADRFLSGFLMGDSGRTMLNFDASMNPPLYKMKDGDNVIHIEALLEGYIYLPPAVKASGYFYSLTSLGSSTSSIIVYTQELENIVVVLRPCTTILLYSDGINWYEIGLTLKS